MSIRIYNSLTREKDEFTPLEDKKVKIIPVVLRFTTTVILGMPEVFISLM